MAKFSEIASFNISLNKQIVISKNESDNISIAQALFVNDGGKLIRMFMKNAIVIDKSDLPKLEEAIKLAQEEK